MTSPDHVPVNVEFRDEVDQENVEHELTEAGLSITGRRTNGLMGTVPAVNLGRLQAVPGAIVERSGDFHLPPSDSEIQ